jgi:LPXTG-motif cell wall-anchored protein
MLVVIYLQTLNCESDLAAPYLIEGVEPMATLALKDLQRRFAFIGMILAVLLLVLGNGFINASPAAAAPLGQCNGTDNVGGEQVECSVTITNNLDQATGVSSSVTTVEECHGAARAEPTCTTTTTSAAESVSVVDQCNGSGNGGGGVVICNVNIINNVVGTGTTGSVTVNQCNEAGTGGGTEPTIACNPFPANTTNATVTQCNEAGQGGGDGGLGIERVRCEVASESSESAALPVKVTQCVGSGNGGGGLVICNTRIVTTITAVPNPGDGETPPGDGDGDGDGDNPPGGGTNPPGDGTGNPPGTETPPGVTTPPGTETPPTGNTPPGDTPPGEPRLPETGADSTAGIIFGSIAILLGGGLLIIARLRRTTA